MFEMFEMFEMGCWVFCFRFAVSCLLSLVSCGCVKLGNRNIVVGCSSMYYDYDLKRMK